MIFGWLLWWALVWFSLAYVIRLRSQRTDLEAAKDRLKSDLEFVRGQKADLLKENELANKECEQNRIVIEAAKDERLKMLTELAELRKARMEAAAALADQSKQAKEQWEKLQGSLNAHADKIYTLAGDIEARSELIRKLSTVAENYRQQISELKTARPARGENGRFARRQVAR